MRAYTQYAYHTKQPLKQYLAHHPHTKEPEVYDEFFESIKEHILNKYTDESRLSLILQVQAVHTELEAKKGNSKHVFLPDLEFCNWLTSCVTSADPDQLSYFIEEFGANVPMFFHFPTESKKCSFMFKIVKENKESPNPSFISVFYSRGLFKKNSFSCVTLDKKLFFDSEKFKVENSEHSNWATRLILGLGLYLKCFPGQSYDGIPKDLKHPNWTKGLNSKTILVHENVIVRNGPCPHYRVGHFKMLSHERFKNKRGQVVFVNGCFVRGQAKTAVGIGEKENNAVTPTSNQTA